jgi:hypothetical protein
MIIMIIISIASQFVGKLSEMFEKWWAIHRHRKWNWSPD